MSTLERKSFTAPDETRSLPKTKVEVVAFGDMTAMKTTFEPGWRWSEHVGPKAGTASCQVLHFGYILSGRIKVRMKDEKKEKFAPVDVVVISQGNDAGFLGNKPYVGFDFQGERPTPSRELVSVFKASRCIQTSERSRQ